jgi:hypothetical protein
MIDSMYTVADVCALLRVEDPRTARKIMRKEMQHTEKPHLIVSERAVKDWLDRQTLPPENEIRRILKRKGA